MSLLNPLVPPQVEAFLADQELPWRASHLHRGPVHVLFPEVMAARTAEIRSALAIPHLKAQVFLSHKPNRSPVFLRQARALGLGLDVASLEELISGLAAGFSGSSLQCTGPKGPEYVLAALQHRCQISVDSIAELELVTRISDRLNRDAVSVLLRVNDPVSRDRMRDGLSSRFGICRKEIPLCFELLRNSPQIHLQGFHFHTEGPSPEIRAEHAHDCLELFLEASAYGHSPQKLNIGGGFRAQELQNQTGWLEYVDTLAQCLLKGQALPTWRGYSFGMRLNDQGRISGREAAENIVPNGDVSSYLSAFLRARGRRGVSVEQLLVENGIELQVEPGYFLLDGAGITLMRALGVKDAGGGSRFAILEGHSHNVSRENREYISEPRLLAREQRLTGPWQGFLGGVSCAERDVIVRRPVRFPCPPAAGDLVAFVNTAHYFSDFYESCPHSHPTGIKLVCHKRRNALELCSEDRYHPLIDGLL